MNGMRSFLPLLVLAALAIGCGKHDSTTASNGKTAPDLEALGSHIKFVNTQATPDPGTKTTHDIDMYMVDMSFEDAKKQIEPELLKHGWQPMSVPDEKGTKQAVYIDMSKGTYSIIAPDTGSPKNCSLAYMTFQPGDIQVIRKP